MTEALAITFASTHVLVLAALILLHCWRRQLPRREWPLVLFLLLWAALIYGGYLASLFDALGQLEIYIPATFAGLAIVLLLHLTAQATGVREIKPNLPAFIKIRPGLLRRSIWTFLIATFATALIINLIIVFNFYPNNSDSLTYRLTRVYWYASHGNLLHPFVSYDNRIVFYPLNGLLLNLPVVVHHLPAYFFNFPSFFCWLAVVYGVYCFARALNADRLVAFATAWLAGLTPSILAQATSTNDDILAAAPLLLGLYFIWRWVMARQEHYIILSVFGLALSIGTKLHIVFLLPIFILGGLFLWPKRKELPPLRWPAIAACGIILLTLGCGFFFCNYLSTDHFYFGSVVGDVFNIQASLRTALQNLLIYASQLILAPFADLTIWLGTPARIAFYQIFNEQWSPVIAPFISDDASHFLQHYHFAGILIPNTSPYLLEFSLWPGFIWLLWLLQASALSRVKFPSRAFFGLMAATPALWLIMWSLLTRYMEGVPVYLSYYLVASAPALIFCFIVTKEKFFDQLRWSILFLAFATNSIISANFLLHNELRGLSILADASSRPVDHNKVDQAVIDEIKRAEDIQILAMHSHVYYLSLMHWHPAAHFNTPFFPVLADAKILKLFPTPDTFGYGFIPIKIAHKATPGLTLLGTMEGVQREKIFAQGNGVDQRKPEQSGYIILALTFSPYAEGYKLDVNQVVPGLNAQDGLEFSYQLKDPNGQLVYKWPWSAQPNISAVFPIRSPRDSYPLDVMIRSAADHRILATATYALAADRFLANLRL